jgi:hypothetical protein
MRRTRKTWNLPRSTDYDVLGMQQLKINPLRDNAPPSEEPEPKIPGMVWEPRTVLAQAHRGMHNPNSGENTHGKRS